MEFVGLVVDDEVGNRRALARQLATMECRVLEAGDGQEALEILQRESPDFILLDLMMPRLAGLPFLKVLRHELHKTVPVIVCSANTHLQIAVEAMKSGATDYIEKPIEPELLRRRIKNILEKKILERQNRRLQEEITIKNHTRLLGNSPSMQKVQASAERLANSSSIVLITGESGTGKELVARSLHDYSGRAREPFVVVDCAALHGSTLESELFGHEKGAFTGAETGKKGLLVSAGRGTIFLDEIGELPLEVQGKFLRVLQEKQVRPMGSANYQPVFARIIAATNRDLQTEVAHGKFREDLFYRLSIVQLPLPGLEERREDIPLLVEHFLNKFAGEYGKRNMDPALLEVLCKMSWPGNVRQLENAIHGALALAPQGEELLDLENMEQLFGSNNPAMQQKPQASAKVQSAEIETMPLVTMQELEKQAIQRALKFTGGNRRQAAEILGIGEATLYRRLRDMDL